MNGIVANPKNVLHLIKKKSKSLVNCEKPIHTAPLIEDNIGAHFMDALDLVCESNQDDDFFDFLCAQIKED